MYHGNLVGGLAARLGRSRAIVWGIRNSALDANRSRGTTLWTIKVGATLSALIPQKIVCCSEVARLDHETMGYRADKMVVIPNGFDLAAFRPDPTARVAVRRELGLPEDALLIGLVARHDPQKDHQNFIEATRLVALKHENIRFVLCGDGIDWSNAQLECWIKSTGIKNRFFLLRRRDDVPRITAALDIASCTSSYGEAFPNVLGEAMACEVPCVTTNVGDSAFIVGDTGIVVPARNPQALADAWATLVEAGADHRQRLGKAARDRVRQEFELGSVASRYQTLYEQVLGAPPTSKVGLQ